MGEQNSGIRMAIGKIYRDARGYNVEIHSHATGSDEWGWIGWCYERNGVVIRLYDHSGMCRSSHGSPYDLVEEVS